MRINEIFYSLQGEGAFTGTPSIFIRFSGCNLKCDFCDTEHQSYSEMSEIEILQAIAKYPARHVVLTGGEPSMQITASFIDLLHRSKKFVQIETNGTFILPKGLGIDWITCSPKEEYCKNAKIKLHHIDELKVVYNGTNDMSIYNGIEAANYYIQPCDMQNQQVNAKILDKAIKFCLKNSRWKLSLQTQKILNVQ